MVLGEITGRSRGDRGRSRYLIACGTRGASPREGPRVGVGVGVRVRVRVRFARPRGGPACARPGSAPCRPTWLGLGLGSGLGKCALSSHLLGRCRGDCGRDVGEMHGRCGRDAGEIVGEMWGRCGGDVGEMWGDAGEMWGDTGRCGAGLGRPCVLGGITRERTAGAGRGRPSVRRVGGSHAPG